VGIKRVDAKRPTAGLIAAMNANASISLLRLVLVPVLTRVAGARIRGFRRAVRLGSVERLSVGSFLFRLVRAGFLSGLNPLSIFFCFPRQVSIGALPIVLM
jgi:hypothetical protein